MTDDTRPAVVFPQRDEMLRLLTAVSDNEHLVEHFYPLLLEDAGKRLFAEGVATMFVLAVRKYNMGQPRAVRNMLARYLPEFLAALVTDTQVRERVMALLRSVGFVD